MRDMEKLNVFPQLEDILKETPKKENLILTVCESCGKNIKKNTWNKKYRHINICQQPVIRFFCSDQCKLSWIFRLPEDVSETKG